MCVSELPHELLAGGDPGEAPKEFSSLQSITIRDSVKQRSLPRVAKWSVVKANKNSILDEEILRVRQILKHCRIRHFKTFLDKEGKPRLIHRYYRGNIHSVDLKRFRIGTPEFIAECTRIHDEWMNHLIRKPVR